MPQATVSVSPRKAPQAPQSPLTTEASETPLHAAGYPRFPRKILPPPPPTCPRSASSMASACCSASAAFWSRAGSAASASFCGQAGAGGRGRGGMGSLLLLHSRSPPCRGAPARPAPPRVQRRRPKQAAFLQERGPSLGPGHSPLPRLSWPSDSPALHIHAGPQRGLRLAPRLSASHPQERDTQAATHAAARSPPGAAALPLTPHTKRRSASSPPYDHPCTKQAAPRALSSHSPPTNPPRAGAWPLPPRPSPSDPAPPSACQTSPAPAAPCCAPAERSALPKHTQRLQDSLGRAVCFGPHLSMCALAFLGRPSASRALVRTWWRAHIESTH